jgi:hypothetical protein
VEKRAGRSGGNQVVPEEYVSVETGPVDKLLLKVVMSD